MRKQRTGYALLTVVADAGSPAQTGRLKSIEARLSLIDKNIGTSARFYA